MEFIATAPPGKALDLGCGTGTNAITLADNGWEVIGVDFAANAIFTARRKAAAAGLDIDFHIADVTDLGFLRGPFDYLLDIGCMFTLRLQDRTTYVAQLERLVLPGSLYMMYAWQPHKRLGKQRGIAPREVESLLAGAFDKERVVTGEDRKKPSAWYWYRKR